MLVKLQLVTNLKFLDLNSYVDSDRRFQHVLEACGVFKSLSKLGVKEGDTVVIGEVCNYYRLLLLPLPSIPCETYFLLQCLQVVLRRCLDNWSVDCLVILCYLHVQLEAIC